MPAPSHSKTEASAGLHATRSVSGLLLVAIATIALIGLSPDKARLYRQAAAALDSLPAYPSLMDTSSSTLARALSEQVERTNAAYASRDPMRTPTVSAIDMLFMDRRWPAFASSGVSDNLVPMGTRIEFPPDRTVASLVGFLESVRTGIQVASPRADSLAEKVLHVVGSLTLPTAPSQLLLEIDPSSVGGAWLETGRVRVHVVARTVPDTSHRERAREKPWRSSAVVEVPADSAIIVSDRELSRRMLPYFQKQMWLGDEPLPTSVRLADYLKLILKPLSRSALGPVDRVKPVLLEVAELDLPSARRYLHQKSEILNERGSITILGLTLESGLAAWIVPLIFVSLSFLLWFHVLHLRIPASHQARVDAGHEWAPLLPAWHGPVTAVVTLFVYPSIAATLFALRMHSAPNGWAAVALVAIGSVVNALALIALLRGRPA